VWPNLGKVMYLICFVFMETNIMLHKSLKKVRNARNISLFIFSISFPWTPRIENPSSRVKPRTCHLPHISLASWCTRLYVCEVNCVCVLHCRYIDLFLLSAEVGLPVCGTYLGDCTWTLCVVCQYNCDWEKMERFQCGWKTPHFSSPGISK